MDNRISIMQPYLFPYLGYFQLIHASDIFVYYDDVNFIKQGWINRNKILIQGNESVFTVPLKSASSFVPINETEINYNLYPRWKEKFLKSIEQSYKRAPHQEEVLQLLRKVFDCKYGSIADMAIASIYASCHYLRLDRIFKRSSEDFMSTRSKDRVERLAEIVKLLDGVTYINPSGGVDLYSKTQFTSFGIDLRFIVNSLPAYSQGLYPFINGLSIIDVMMWNEKEKIAEMLVQYELK